MGSKPRSMSSGSKSRRNPAAEQLYFEQDHAVIVGKVKDFIRKQRSQDNPVAAFQNVVVEYVRSLDIVGLPKKPLNALVKISEGTLENIRNLVCIIEQKDGGDRDLKQEARDEICETYKISRKEKRKQKKLQKKLEKVTSQKEKVSKNSPIKSKFSQIQNQLLANSQVNQKLSSNQIPSLSAHEQLENITNCGIQGMDNNIFDIIQSNQILFAGFDQQFQLQQYLHQQQILNLISSYGGNQQIDGNLVKSNNFLDTQQIQQLFGKNNQNIFNNQFSVDKNAWNTEHEEINTEKNNSNIYKNDLNDLRLQAKQGVENFIQRETVNSRETNFQPVESHKYGQFNHPQTDQYDYNKVEKFENQLKQIQNQTQFNNFGLSDLSSEINYNKNQNNNINPKNANELNYGVKNAELNFGTCKDSGSHPEGLEQNQCQEKLFDKLSGELKKSVLEVFRTCLAEFLRQNQGSAEVALVQEFLKLQMSSLLQYLVSESLSMLDVLSRSSQFEVCQNRVVLKQAQGEMLIGAELDLGTQPEQNSGEVPSAEVEQYSIGAMEFNNYGKQVLARGSGAEQEQMKQHLAGKRQRDQFSQEIEEIKRTVLELKNDNAKRQKMYPPSGATFLNLTPPQQLYNNPNNLLFQNYTPVFDPALHQALLSQQVNSRDQKLIDFGKNQKRLHAQSLRNRDQSLLNLKDRLQENFSNFQGDIFSRDSESFLGQNADQGQNYYNQQLIGKKVDFQTGAQNLDEYIQLQKIKQELEQEQKIDHHVRQILQETNDGIDDNISNDTLQGQFESTSVQQLQQNIYLNQTKNNNLDENVGNILLKGEQDGNNQLEAINNLELQQNISQQQQQQFLNICDKNAENSSVKSENNGNNIEFLCEYVLDKNQQLQEVIKQIQKSEKQQIEETTGGKQSDKLFVQQIDLENSKDEVEGKRKFVRSAITSKKNQMRIKFFF